MSRPTIQSDGSIVYRTKLIFEAKAQSFAAMLRGNSRFEDVKVKHSGRAKSDAAFFVTFQPVSEVRKDAIFMDQWKAREQRALDQECIFWPDPDLINVWNCFSCKSGETYQVTLGDCTCPDYHFRCQKAGLNCYHQHSLSAFLRTQNEQIAA